jgi:hypothetical protein
MNLPDAVTFHPHLHCVIWKEYHMDPAVIIGEWYQLKSARPEITADPAQIWILPDAPPFQPWDVFEWKGGAEGHGQYIEIGTMTATCKMNATICATSDGSGALSIVTIGVADLLAAIELGLLVKVPR